MWSSSDSDNEEEDKIDTDDTYNSDSDMLGILSSLVCSLWKRTRLNINTDFSVTGWMLCVSTHILKDAKDH